MLVVPKLRTKEYGSRKLSYAAATLWNDLHSTIEYINYFIDYLFEDKRYKHYSIVIT